MPKGRRVNRRKKGKKNIAVLLILLIILFISVYLITYYGYMKRHVEAYNYVLYPKVFIEDIDMGGKSKAEALKLMNEKSREIIENDIKVKFKDKEYTINYEDLQIESDMDKTIDEAMKYGKDLSLIEKYNLIKKPIEKSFDIKYTYNTEIVNSLLKDIDITLSKEIKDATLSKESGKLVVSEDTSKEEIKKEEFMALIEDTVKENTENNKGDITLELPMNITEADVKAEDLNKINTIISSFSTNFVEDARANNIRIAAKAASGMFLMPGEEYSFNKLVGESTKDKGYIEAPIIMDNKLKPELGGGVCQVSTTLHNAVLRAGIMPSERTHHSMPVTYVDKGMDATIYYESVDYKFKNTLEYPIYIDSVIDNGSLIFTIYSYEELIDKKYEVYSEIYEEKARNIVYEKDIKLDEGEEQIANLGSDGYKVKVHKKSFNKGEEIKDEIIYDDIYESVDKVIKRNK